MKYPSYRHAALFFSILFLIVVVITNIPAFNDAQGYNFGLYKIDPIDNLVHFLTFLLGAVAVWYSSRSAKIFLIVFGTLYALDALVGLFLSRGLLDLTVFTDGRGFSDFSISNILVNAPHIGISFLMLACGLGPSRKGDQ
jgi:hypothetical protein